jgi:uncharacterized protein YdhG (YjbR/CyaY superfamily)
LPAERRSALAKLRCLVLEVAPDAVETMKYRMPTYVYGHVLCSFASQKHTMSLYTDPDVVARHRQELAGLSVGISCIRFRRIADLPWATVRCMLEESVRSRKGR